MSSVNHIWAAPVRQRESERSRETERERENTQDRENVECGVILDAVQEAAMEQLQDFSRGNPPL